MNDVEKEVEIKRKKIEMEEKRKRLKEHKIKKEKEREESKKRTTFFATTVIVFFVLFKFIILNGIIPSESMEPTVNTGDLIIVNRLAYISSEPERFDIVVFGNNNSYVIKRVIGLPGDTVEITNGVVYVNDKLIDEPYLQKSNSTYVLPKDLKERYIYEVPDDSMFLLGDNRENSLDSRYWDDPFISYNELIGRYLFSYRLPIISNRFDK